MIKCIVCGGVFDDCDMETLTESNGERWGACPYCMSNDLAGVKQCEICEDYKTEVVNGMCNDCYTEQLGAENFTKYLQRAGLIEDLQEFANETDKNKYMRDYFFGREEIFCEWLKENEK